MRLIAGIPSSGARGTLAPLVSTLRTCLPGSDVLVGLNGHDSFLAASALAGELDCSVLETPGGYSSSRNALLSEARSVGGTHLLFVDDDVVLTPLALQAWIDRIRAFPDSMVGLQVRRYPEVSSRLFEAIFNPSGSREVYSVSVPSIPASCLAVPLSLAVSQAGFPKALNWTGGEDTYFSWSARVANVPLLMVTDPYAIEVHLRSRMRPVQLLSRVIANSVTLRHTRAGLAYDQQTWRSVAHGRALMTVSLAALGGIGWLLPRTSVRLAKLFALLLWARGYLPTRESGTWSLLRIARS